MVQALPRKLSFMEFLESYPEQGRYELIEGTVVRSVCPEKGRKVL
jgi:hypothetical protein